MVEREKVVGVTIDSQETRDIDDAIWVERLESGWKVTATIADVAKYVAAGSEVDQWARGKLATRYYETGNIPMLPRKLSENKLSLWPGTEKRTVSVELELGDDLEVRSSRVFRSKLKSEAKLAFAEIPQILKNEKNEFHELVSNSTKLAMGLLEKRRSAGALALYDLNTGWVTTEEGYLKRLESHEETVGYIIIQELMVLANGVVADYAVEHDIPVLFRNHEARPATPGHAELVQQLRDAIQTPMADLKTLRQRIHMLLDKATYGVTLKGHYGLNLPAYLHFTSPIRRYPDLIIHRQIRAFLKGEKLPYTKGDLEVLSKEINDKLVRDKKTMSQHMKEKAEKRAGQVSDSKTVRTLSDKDFERLVKLEARSGNEISVALQAGFKARLADNQVPLICIAVLFTDAPRTEGWQALRQEALQWLARNREASISILAMVPQTANWPEAEYVLTSEGPPHAQVFKATVRVDGNGVSGMATETGSSSKAAKQNAGVNLFAKLYDLDPVDFTKVVETATPAAPTVAGRSPISALGEYCQAKKIPMPDYKFTMSGPPHMPEVECICTLRDISRSAKSTSKKTAKAEAAKAVVQALGI